MPVSQLVALRNMKDGVTVLTPDPKDPNNYLRFEAHNDPEGADVQYVSEELATMPVAVKAIMHGVLSVEKDHLSPDIQEAFERQMSVARRQRDQAEAAVKATIERTEARDMIGEKCVGPGQRMGQECGDTIARSEQAKKEHAPLCARHTHLAHEYVRIELEASPEDYTDQGKKTRYRWVRAEISKRDQE